jgi:hypothetical protein
VVCAHLVDSAPSPVILYTCRRCPVSAERADRRAPPPHQDLLLPRVCCIGVVFRGLTAQGSRGLRSSGRRRKQVCSKKRLAFTPWGRAKLLAASYSVFSFAYIGRMTARCGVGWERSIAALP